jgi:hypothetical protein
MTMTLRYGRLSAVVGAATLALAGGSAPASAQDTDRLYGEVRTTSGEYYEGYIRWDRNEAGWWDLLDGSKALDADMLAWMSDLGPDERRDRSIEFLGVRVSWNDDDVPSSAQSGIRFGHIRTLRSLGDGEVLLTLRSGEEVELFGGATDLGTSNRGIEIEDSARGLIELRWRDLDRIEFRTVPAGAVAASTARLFGTARDRWGNRYTGFVSWDMDETLASDILDGEERGRDREVVFERIREIERLGSRGARVVLTDGAEMVLSGSNDVDSGHRGVQISDPALGQVDIPWRSFESIRFETVPDGLGGAETFDGGRRLVGTIETEDGERFTGTILWDGDEAWSWEILDGSWRGIEYDIEFGQIAAIVKRSSRSAEVTLVDGRTFELEGSNDVDRDNKGIVVEMDDGEAVLIDWDRFREVSFRNR